ncbi:MAG: FAD-binding oxidoreductase [Desulfobacterales bacterium]|nr:MAG: FAD-binding oxidoreductase [Desulfobacterales bacterium]
MNARFYDVIIAGGGIMGSATAFYLMKADDRLKVAVVERDPTYSQASTTLSASNVRIQFSLKENIQISRYAFEVLEKFEDEMIVEGEKPRIYFRREGNLFLVDEAGRRAAEEALALQQSLGCPVEWWSPAKIKQRYPLYATGGLVGGTFGPRDGHFDAYAVLMGYKAKARSLGAVYIKDEVGEIVAHSKRVSGVRLSARENLSAPCVVNCAGAWAAQLAATAGVKLPVVPVKRQVFVLHTAVKPEGPLPLTVLPSGLYFRSETGGLILLGKSMADDPVGYNFTWDDKRFMEILWPELAAFVPAFDRLKLVRGWAGLYAVNTLDGNAILGEWPEVKGLYLANGFSGHGLQQAPAVGRFLAELILERPLSLDLSIFRPERILENRPLSEGGLV